MCVKRDHCTALWAVQHPSMTPTGFLVGWVEYVRAIKSERAANSSEAETSRLHMCDWLHMRWGSLE